MKFKIIINYKSVRECYMAINPMIRKILYSFIGTSLVMSIVFYCFHQIVFSAAFFLFMEKIEDLAHTNELWGEIVFDESALKVIPYGNTESEYSMEYSRFKDFYILKHYCVFGDKRKIEKGLTQETIIIDKTVLTEADMHNLTSLIHEKMPQVKVHEKERKNN